MASPLGEGRVGVASEPRLALAFPYPRSEGDRTGIGGRAQAWSLRSHPLRVGFEQRYGLRVTLGTSKGFADAVQATWRRAFDLRLLRLYLLTKNPHFLRFARFAMDATKQLGNWDGKLV